MLHDNAKRFSGYVAATALAALLCVSVAAQAPQEKEEVKFRALHTELKLNVPSSETWRPFYERSEVIPWLKQAAEAKDPVVVWIQAAEQGNAYVKWVAATELNKLGDPRAIPVLEKLALEPRVQYDNLGGELAPYYDVPASTGVRTIQALHTWREIVEAKPTPAARLDAAHAALSHEDFTVRKWAFEYVAAYDTPQNATSTFLDAFAKSSDYGILPMMIRILSAHSSEEWVIPYLSYIKDVDVPEEVEKVCLIHTCSTGILAQIEAEKQWKELLEPAQTPQEKKDVALRVLTTTKDEPLRWAAMGYVDTLAVEEQIPIWIQCITVHDLIQSRLLEIGGAAVPELLRSLDDHTDVGRVRAVLEVLCALRDDRAIDPIAELMLLPLDPDGSAARIRNNAGSLLVVGFRGRSIPALARVLGAKDSLAVVDAARRLAVIATEGMGDRASIIALLEERLKTEQQEPTLTDGAVEDIRQAIEKIQSAPDVPMQDHYGTPTSIPIPPPIGSSSGASGGAN